ncbi:hypothetical protein R1flu_004347 [Riccia fluitans]|uniref:SNARE-interacting protein KEULE n=1 Tax=Riccia fluitans TaxID=41844 RepID=A0ABD1YQ14_9MARC
MSDGDSSYGGWKNFRQMTRDRLLHEMLRTVKGETVASWKVLIMDEVTVKVMSNACKMADITDEGISLVEDLSKRRQPLPALEAVYFIQPIRDSVQKFIADMAGKTALYKKAYVFFSSPLPRDYLNLIKSEQLLLSRIAALREMNLEYLTIDTQGFSTDNDKALVQLFGELSEGTRDYEVCLDTIAYRLSTVFASLKEFPLVRYRAAKSSAPNSVTATTGRDLVPTKMAAALWERLMKYKTTLANFPKTETCELIIVDRSVDLVAPIIHEWTYDAMCHDLLDMDGNKFSYEVKLNTGRSDKKEVLLEEHDPVWLELRDLHIAEVNLKLDEKMQQFGAKNKAAQIRLGAKEGQELSTRDMQKMVQALPQYRDQIEKLSLHIHIATVINNKIKEDALDEVGNLEQDLVFGDATSKELISILNAKQELSAENKLRLLMIYAATHPEKLDATKRLQWMKLARLTGDDMNAINNLEYLGVSVTKKTSGGFSLKFGSRKNKRSLRKERAEEEGAWKLSRFYPVLQDLVEDLVKGELSKEEYPYVKEPANGFPTSQGSNPNSPASAGKPQVFSRRTNRPAGTTWASKGRSMDEGSNDSRSSNHSRKPMGKRIFVFVIGGITRSELRIAHKLTAQLRREVVIGCSSVDSPQQFIRKMKGLSSLDDVEL